jgi:hypothetical protein
VEVRCDEGVAIHIGPKPCVCAREGAGEASAGERKGQPLSRESQIIQDADVLIPTEGDMAVDFGFNVRCRFPRRFDPGFPLRTDPG